MLQWMLKWVYLCECIFLYICWSECIFVSISFSVYMPKNRISGSYGNSISSLFILMLSLSLTSLSFLSYFWLITLFMGHISVLLYMLGIPWLDAKYCELFIVCAECFHLCIILFSSFSLDVNRFIWKWFDFYKSCFLIFVRWE